MAIKITNLFHVYNKNTEIENTSLKGINLELNDHFFAALIGKTGSGKSTLAQHLNYLLKPTEGIIEIDEFKISTNKKEMKKFKKMILRKNVGYLFQFSENQLFCDNVLKEVCFGPLNFGFSEEEAERLAKESLNKVQIDESFYNRSPLELSGGEKRRIAISSVLACQPKIIILDEPTAGLDAEGRNNLMSLLKEIYESGISILLITHDMDVVYSLCETVIELDEGNVKSVKKTYDYFVEKSNDENAIIPKIFRFCSVFEDEKIKKCKSIDEFMEVISHE